MMPLYRTLVRPGRLDGEQRLQDHHAAHFDGEASAVSFMTIPTGFMFTEGRQSTSSVIAWAIAHTTTLPQREAYMRGICDLWSEVTGCTDHEIVVSVTETA
ncbi:MAG: hypothetical protein AAF945_17470 [Actinomycetota bacterium]